MSKKSFSKQYQILDTSIFDEFTSSNAESEYASLKKKSLGVNANVSMTTLTKKKFEFCTKK